MEAGSEREINRNMNHSPSEGSKRPKRQMKTPFQLEMLEKTYASMSFFFFSFHCPLCCWCDLCVLLCICLFKKERFFFSG